MQLQICMFCGHTAPLVHVHGHYQCRVCHTNALPCCDGDNCETNELLKTPASAAETDSVSDEGKLKLNFSRSAHY